MNYGRLIATRDISRTQYWDFGMSCGESTEWFEIEWWETSNGGYLQICKPFRKTSKIYQWFHRGQYKSDRVYCGDPTSHKASRSVVLNGMVESGMDLGTAVALVDAA